MIAACARVSAVIMRIKVILKKERCERCCRAEQQRSAHWHRTTAQIGKMNWFSQGQRGECAGSHMTSDVKGGQSPSNVPVKKWRWLTICRLDKWTLMRVGNVCPLSCPPHLTSFFWLETLKYYKCVTVRFIFIRYGCFWSQMLQFFCKANLPMGINKVDAVV